MDTSNMWLATLVALMIVVSLLAFVIKRRLSKLDGKIVLKAIQERRSNAMDILMFEVTLPPAVGGAKKYTLIVERDETAGGDLVAYERIEVDALDPVARVEVAQDTSAKLTVSAVDEAGNESEPVSTSFVAVDTIAPTLEGNIGIKAVGERSSIASAPAEVPAEEAPVVSSDDTVADVPAVVDAPEIPAVETPADENPA